MTEVTGKDNDDQINKLPGRVGRLVCLLLGTTTDGEALAALAGLKRILNAAGIDHHDLAAIIEGALEKTVTDWRNILRECCDHADNLTDRERVFLDSMARWNGDPTEKQLKWLVDIWDHLKSGRPR